LHTIPITIVKGSRTRQYVIYILHRFNKYTQIIKKCKSLKIIFVPPHGFEPKFSG
jgi:hypothetical protein